MINALHLKRYSRVSPNHNHMAPENDGAVIEMLERSQSQSPVDEPSRETEDPPSWDASRNHRISHVDHHDYPEIFRNFSNPRRIKTLEDPTKHHGYIQEYDTAASYTPQKYVKWGVQWQHPTMMILFTLAGIILAVGHHFFYLRLDGTKAGPPIRQQWATAFGTAFSFFTLALLTAAGGAAYKEYVWVIVRKRAFTFHGLDKLFALTSDPTGFFSWELLKTGKIAMLLALTCWAMTLAGIAPPATLNVVPGLQNKTTIAPWPMLDWNLTDWSVRMGPSAVPSSDVLDLAWQAAIDSKIPTIASFASNSSYNFQFYGPTVSCSIANATQQFDFDYYIEKAANQSLFLTESLWKDGFTEATDMLYWSAFAPTLGPTGWLNFLTQLPGQVPIDEYSDWAVELPENYTTNLEGYNTTAIDVGDGSYESGAPLSLWVQTANESFICTMGNASFDVGFNYTNGAQSITHNHIGAMEPVVLPLQPDMPLEPRYYAYAGVFIALASMLSGNVTTLVELDQFAASSFTGENETDPALRVMQWDTSSKMLRTGLTGCSDFSDNYWADHPIMSKNILDQNTTGDSAIIAMEVPAANRPNLTNAVTFKDPSLCRNRTLMHAVQDLANNITIAMLATNFTSGNTTSINVTTWSTHNVYEYSPRNLFISYGIAILIACLAVSLGMYALSANGVSHSTAFSAVVATTRNPRLDGLCEGESLGALPLDRRLGGVKLRFGVIGQDGKGYDGLVPHVGFGVEDEVGDLEKNGRYI